MSGAALDARIVVHRGHAGSLTVRADLRAAPGEAVALIGPSGAGKSTILQAIAGAAPLTEGEITIGGRVVASTRHSTPAHRRGVVLLDQNPRLFPHLSAGENVAFGLRACGLAKAEAAGRAADWLTRVGLSGLDDRAPERLSGGQQQRVALARALAIEPALVLLDEPFTSLDVETAANVRALVQEQLATSGATAVVVTHSAADAAALTTRIVVIEDGLVAQRGALRDVLDQPATRFAAAFADVNRIEGAVRDGVWSAGGALRIGAGVGGDVLADGRVSAVVRPADVRIERVVSGIDEHDRRSTVLRVQQQPDGVRIVSSLPTAAPDAPHESAAPEIAADLDTAAAAALALRPGDAVRLSIDPQHVRLVPRKAERGLPSIRHARRA